jgi:hypothetical protein
VCYFDFLYAILDGISSGSPHFPQMPLESAMLKAKYIGAKTLLPWSTSNSSPNQHTLDIQIKQRKIALHGMIEQPY